MACKSRPLLPATESATGCTSEPPGQPAAHSDLHVELPCVDGLLVGTLALMTGYAEHQCEQGSPRSRDLMAQKIVSNLYLLATHPNLSAPMAAVMRNLQKHWHTLTALTRLESSAAPCAGQPSNPFSAHARPPSPLAGTSQPQAFWLPEQPNVH